MAGHSKFKNIQHRKGKQDALRAKQFSKLGREITVAARLGGGDPAMNARLRLAVAAAKAQSMPKANIENAIQKGTGAGTGDDYFEIRYEGYGPGGVAVVVEALTDNKNRTAGEVRSTFSKYGGNMGETGSVGFMFDRVGNIQFPASVASADSVFEAALNAGADNVESTEEGHEITCSVSDFAAVRDALEAQFGEPETQGLIWKPNLMTSITEEQAVDLFKLIEALEDNDDVQNVTTNFEVSDEVMRKLMV